MLVEKVQNNCRTIFVWCLSVEKYKVCHMSFKYTIILIMRALWEHTERWFVAKRISRLKLKEVNIEFSRSWKKFIVSKPKLRLDTNLLIKQSRPHEKFFNKWFVINFSVICFWRLCLTHSVTGSDWVYRDGKSFEGLFAKFRLIFF